MIDTSTKPLVQLIVVVEDDEFLSDAYQLKFEQAGLPILSAKDGEAGLALIKEKKPALVILDIMLPKMDGFGLLKKMKADASLEKIPVVIASNFADDEYKKKAKALGAVDFFVKSEIALTDLIARCHVYLKDAGRGQTSPKN